jgi:hypothetical protein
MLLSFEMVPLIAPIKSILEQARGRAVSEDAVVVLFVSDEGTKREYSHITVLLTDGLNKYRVQLSS